MKNMKNLAFKAKTVNTSWSYQNYVEVELEIEEANNWVLDNFSIEEVLKHFDKDEILEEIGIDYIKEYFDLKDINDAK